MEEEVAAAVAVGKVNDKHSMCATSSLKKILISGTLFRVHSSIVRHGYRKATNDRSVFWQFFMVFGKTV